MSPVEVDANVRRVVKMLMSVTGSSAEDLAPVLSISRSAMFQRLNGTSRFTVAELASLADHFDVDPGMFFADPQTLLRRRATLPDQRAVSSVQTRRAA